MFQKYDAYQKLPTDWPGIYYVAQPGFRPMSTFLSQPSECRLQVWVTLLGRPWVVKPEENLKQQQADKDNSGNQKTIRSDERTVI